jgi:predicted aspartyl protease
VLRRQFSALLLALLLCGPAAAAAPTELDVGIGLFNQGKYNDAITHLSAAQAVPSLMNRALYYRGLAELKLGKSSALDTLRALVALAPNSPEGKLAERYLSAAAGTAQAPALRLQDRAAEEEEKYNPPAPHVRIPFVDGRDGWMHVQATINTNQIVDMVWDTGASNCSIPVNVFGRIPQDAKTTQVETPAGKEPAYISRIPIEVGGLKRTALTTLMSGTAVIGQSFFRNYEVEVNRQEHAIYLDYVPAGGAATRPKATADLPLDSPLVVTADGAVRRVPIRRGRTIMPIATPAPKPRAAIHFEREAGLCLINILVDNRPVQAYFDTGCAARGIAMTAAMAASARDQLVEKTNKQLEHQKLVDLQLGPVKLANVKVTIANGLSRPLVGPAILGLRNYRIDPVRQEINFDLYDD